MGLFDIFSKNRTGMNELVEEMRNIPEAKLIDVREPEEFAAGHIPGSMNIPVSSLAMAAEAVPDKGIPVYVYCQTGIRSRHAAEILKNSGFTNVTDLGGINAFKGALEM